MIKISKENLETSDNSFLALKNLNSDSSLLDELSGLEITFEKIKIPSGGSLSFEMPDENSVKDFNAVILHHHTIQAYYENKYTGGNQPPDCGSFDGVVGAGNPGGDCITCRFNKYKSGENGSKACKLRHRIYLLQEGEIFPKLLSLPTASVKEFVLYLTRLVSKGIHSNKIITKFSLSKATNNSGIVYSKANFSTLRMLSEDEYKNISILSEQFKKFITSKTIYENIEEETEE